MASHAPLNHAHARSYYAPMARPAQAARPARRYAAYSQQDDVDVRKWPVQARLLLMIVSSLMLWLGIAAALGLLR